MIAPGAQWLKFWASAVCLFGLSRGDAWQCTPIEYWALYDFKAMEADAKRTTVPPMTRSEFEAMKEWDEARGNSREE